MEEIDIIELLQRIKEGKAPKEIEINKRVYRYTDTWDLKYLYAIYIDGRNINCFDNEAITLNTKIKILDKPKIEKMKIHKNDNDNPILIKKDGKTNNLRTIDVEIINKINEIIDILNKENKDE